MSEFKIDGETYSMIDPSKITFAEADAVERVTGHTFGAMQEDEDLMRSARCVQALIWVSVKRAKPEFKFSDLNDLPIDAIEWLEAEPTADPSQPAVAGDTDRSES